MALHWSVKGVADYEVLCFDAETEQLRTLTEILVMMSMAGGYQKITEKNAEEVHRRLGELFELGFYQYRAVKHEAYRAVLLEEVKCHIGLWTNASTKTKRQFAADIRHYKKEDARDLELSEARQAAREATEI